MHINELDRYFRSILAIDELEKVDASLNGLQVGRKSSEIRKAAFAVDACMQVFGKARDRGADIVFVHHGLFWGKPLAVTGSHYARIGYLIDTDTALYAVHLPLDMHGEFGNNAALASKLNLQKMEAFGRYHGVAIGWKGFLENKLSIEQILQRIGIKKDDCLALFPFGSDTVDTVGIISGGAPHEIGQAINQGLDLYITGEASHVMYHQALEAGINVICGGHYNTEIHGVRMLAERCARDTGIETFFIDNPTGL